MSRYDLAVIGAGVAGLAAATEATRRGLAVCLIDERTALGGVATGAGLGASVSDPESCWLIPPILSHESNTNLVQELLGEVSNSRLEIQLDSLVWGVFPGWVLPVSHGGGTSRVEADQLIIATGLYVTPDPFPGHTLAGVLDPLQVYLGLRSGTIRRGDRVVVLGDNVISVALAEAAKAKNVSVVAILAERKIASGATSFKVIELTGAPEVEGDGRVQLVNAPGAGKLAADWLFVATPVSAAGELANLAGCEFRWHGLERGFIPKFDATMATTVEGVYAAGGVAGATDAATAVASGRLAGLSAARRAGKISDATYVQAAAPWKAQIVSLIDPPSNDSANSAVYVALAEREADFAICKCTDHMLGELQTAINLGCHTLDDVKRVAGVGMGLCQGRNCSRTVVHLLASQAGVDPAGIRPLRVRPPIRPLPVLALLEEEVR